jgi:hypothetical protein
MRAALKDPAEAASIQVFLGWCRCLYELGDLVHAVEVGTAALNEIDSVNAQESDLTVQLIATVAAVWYELGDLRARWPTRSTATRKRWNVPTRH